MGNVVWQPQPKQAAFMARPEYEALYGGAAGGGKSDALVVEALRQVGIPHYKALIVRKTYPPAGGADRQEPELLPQGLSQGPVQRQRPHLDLSQRGQDSVWLHAVHKGPHPVSGTGL